MNGRATHAGTEVGAVMLKVRDMTISEAFYTEVLGLKVLNRYRGATSLTADGISPLVVLKEIPNAVVMPERSTSGLYHFALLVPARRDLGAALRHLAERRVAVGSADHDVSEALYLSDPDGNGIELYWDRPRSSWRRLDDGQIYMNAEMLDVRSLIAEAEGTEWEGLPVGTKMGHVHLHVKQLAESEAFYCKLLGFRVTLRYGPSALFISAGGYHHHIGLNIWAGANAPTPPDDAVGLAYYTIVNPDPAHIEDILAWLAERGVSVEAKGDGWYFNDPNGIGIRLTTCPIL